MSLRSLDYVVDEQPIVFSPHLLPIELEGRPQNRERVFIIGIKRSDLTRFSIPNVENAPLPGWHPSRWRIEDLLGDDSQTPGIERYGLRDDDRRWLAAWQEFIEIVEDLPSFPIWANAFHMRPRIVPSMPDWKKLFLQKNSELYMDNRKELRRWRDKHDVEHFPASRQKFEWQAKGEPRDLSKLLIHLRPSGIRVRPATYLPALVAINQASIVGRRQRRITPREAAWLQGFPPDFPIHQNDAIAYRQFGNAVNVGVVKYLFEKILRPTMSDAAQLELMTLLAS